MGYIGNSPALNESVTTAQLDLSNGSVSVGSDVDGSDRNVTFGHSTLKSVIGIDDDQDVFAINTDNAFEAANDLEIDASGNITVPGALTTGAITSAAAFTLGSGSQFKEVAKGTGSWTHAYYTTIHSAGATEDGMWMSILTSSDGAAYGVIWFHSANGGDTHSQQQPITNLSSAGQWSGDNLQISQSSGGTLTVNWVLYQLTKD
jgi:hypothetical protein